MAAPSSVSGVLPPVRLVCAMFQFPRGCPQPCTFTESFGPLQDKDAQARLANLQLTRERMAKLLGSDLGKPIIPRSEPDMAPASEVVACMEQYFRCLAQLTLSIEANPLNTSVQSPFSVEWPSQLTRVAMKVKLNSQANASQIIGALHLETTMLLASRAFMLANSAVDAIGSSGTGDPRVAAQMLSTAAGILDNLGHKIENEWAETMNGLVSVDQRPVETLPATCTAFSYIFLAQAQQCSVAQAIHSGLAMKNPALMAKLCLGIVKQLQTGVFHLRGHAPQHVDSITGIASKSEAACTLSIFWSFESSLWMSFAHSFQARAEWANGRYGAGVGLMKRAVALLQASKDTNAAAQIKPQTKNKSKNGPAGSATDGTVATGIAAANWKVVRVGLPAALEGRLKDFESDIFAWREAEERRLAEYQKENDVVYFQMPPSEEDLEMEMPEPHVMMKAKPFVDPDVVPLSLVRTAEVRDESEEDDEEGGRAESEEFVLEGVIAPPAEDAPPPFDHMIMGVLDTSSPGEEDSSECTLAEVTMPPPPSYEAASGEAESNLVNMGFAVEKVREALEKHGGNQNAALEDILRQS